MDIDSYPLFTVEGPAPNALANTVGVSQPRPMQPLHFSVGGPSPIVEGRENLDPIEERLRAVEGFSDYPFADMTDLCLVLDVVIPPKFKVPDFDRYKGTTCPKNHLKMYYNKLVGYMPSSFADLVFVGERIEVGLKRGKFDYVSPANTNNRRYGPTGAKRKERDAHVVTSAPAWPKF